MHQTSYKWETNYMSYPTIQLVYILVFRKISKFNK